MLAEIARAAATPTRPAPQVFGRERLLSLNPRTLAGLLAANTATWPLALEVWRLYEVADPVALALKNGQVLTYNWLHEGRLVNLLALQHCMRLSAAGVVERFATYVTKTALERLAGRLLLLEQQGLLPRLVPDKQAAMRQWRRERQLPGTKPAAGKPPLIGLRDVASLPDAACTPTKLVTLNVAYMSQSM